jgi:hypothetical protein
VSDDLVNPAGFPARAADLDTGTITDAAQNVRSMGATVEQKTRTISARWAGLGAHYEAPEQGQVYAVLDPALTSADELHTAFSGVARALDTFASALDAIKPRLADLERRAADFRASVIDGVQVDASSAKSAGFGDYVVGAFDWVPGVEEEKVTVPWYEDGDSIARNEALVNEYHQIAADISAANEECANAINALVQNSCVAPVEAIPAEAFASSEQPMPWGSARQEDRNCPESVGHGTAQFGTGLWDGARQMIVGYDPETGGYFESSAYGQAWGGLGDLVGSTLLMASPVGWVAAGMSATGNTDNDFHRWMYDRAETVVGGWGSLIGYDAAAEDPWHAWKEDGVAAGTTAVLSVGTFFIPGAGQVGAGLKAGSIGAKVARIAATGADFAVQGGSWVVRGGLRVTSGLRGALRFGDDVLPSPGQVAHGADGVRLSPTALVNAVDDVPASVTGTSTPVGDAFGLAPSRADAPDTVTARPGPDAATADGTGAGATPSGAQTGTPQPGPVRDGAADTGSAQPGPVRDGAAEPHSDGPSTPRQDGAPSAATPESGADSGPTTRPVGDDAAGTGTGGTDAGAPDSPATGQTPEGAQTPERPQTPETAADAAPARDTWEPAPTHPRPSVAQTVTVDASDLPGPQTPFARATDLQPDTLYQVTNHAGIESDFYTDGSGAVVYVETTYGRTGALNWDLMKPQPDTTYVVHPQTNGASGSYTHVFQTDSAGRTVAATTDDLQRGVADRSPSVQQRIGSVGTELHGQPYEGGHLLANMFGGGPETTNLVAMLEAVNRGKEPSFTSLERQWDAAIARGQKVEVDIRAAYDTSGAVPEAIAVRWTIDGVPGRKVFENVPE